MGQHYCATPDCIERTDGHGDLCPTCRQRRARGTPPTPRPERLTSPFGRVVEAGISLANAETDHEWRAAEEKARRAALAYAAHLRRGGA